ncbi:hypothetical protein FKW77_004755 [Venturia effusa]|uniref:Enoyl reductase (ER) domain-containing protein n=1 Tax=Venturia effusa TaxID=50376 RepID=A0A517LNV9_9PEZI|nr:hypothetical protein FKW77_004755 [Venturia effusa]
MTSHLVLYSADTHFQTHNSTKKIESAIPNSEKMMKAIHYTSGGGPPSSLQLQTLEIPKPGPTDLLVQIKACSVNPVDTKIRQGKFPASDITGYDAAGTVTEVGSQVTGFGRGDAVIYSGRLGAQGSTAQHGLVDYRLAAPKPRGWDWADASSIPLVGLTAWEMLVDHFGIEPGDTVRNGKEAILIVNGAGGVGSAATQFSRVFGLGEVVVTASREETVRHAEELGATVVIDHHKDLKSQLKEKGIDGVKYIMICHSTPLYIEQACEIAKPWGKIGSIVECEEPLNFQGMAAFTKSLSFHWEFMFANAVSDDDAMMRYQGGHLKEISRLCEEGKLKSTVTQTFELSAGNLRKAHEILESGKAIGKIALTVGDDIEE